jgi:hypothetical protein
LIARTGRRTWRRAVLLSAAVVLGWPASPRAQVPQVAVDPPQLRMATFSGQQYVLITVRVAPDATPVVVIRRPAEEALFNRKVRVGPIWLNKGRVHISGVPALLLCFSPASIETLLGRADIDRYQLDARAIREGMRVEPAELDAPALRDSYLALREGDGSYRFAAAGHDPFEAGAEPGWYLLRLPWPMRAPTAMYDVTLYECRGGHVAGTVTVPFEVARTGLAAWLAARAVDRAPLYGAVAVAVALSLGFGIDFLVTFVRRRGSRHGRQPPEHSTGHLGAH